ncbi:MAG TPA: SPOR domain-containing protein [Thermomonas sp.]|nr:SPOR domain-containing protein [Thermomonas sp.]
MLLRATIVILVMLNLGAAAWWLLRPLVAGAAGTQAVAVDAPGLRLVGEPAAAIAPVPAPGGVVPAPLPTISPAQAEVATAAATAAAPAAIVEACLRFGPFAEPAARDAARAALSAAGVSAVTRDSPARSGRGWQVAMPALASREEAVAMAERIKAAGINDLYVMNEGTDANSIALGRFGGEEAARRREAELRGKGFAAQATPLGDTAAQAWLDARLPAAANRAALAAVAPSRGIDCATLR